MDDDLLRNRLAEAFRRSSRNPHHLAFLVLPVVEDVIREAKAEAWDEGWNTAWTPMSPHHWNAGPNPYRD